ncbi:glycerol-3-phosphate responsive antiterminator [Metabacillus dongyingensis]|uniref:glycerol-3-phosphate responsive antiterminator n=1 Tax=Metabacillus dongyingensis TaxID=2874282 RepID=UPI003B8AA8DA
MDHIKQLFKFNPIVAAVRDVKQIEDASESNVQVIFLMTGDIFNIKHCVDTAKQHNKSIFLHVDLMKGIAKDKEGIKYLAREIKPDGIITTKSNLIKLAKKEELIAIQHLFFLDTHAYTSGVRNIMETKPDAIEIMPGLMPRVIKDLSKVCPYPIISAGLIKSHEEILEGLEAGSNAVAVGASELWKLKLN